MKTKGIKVLVNTKEVGCLDTLGDITQTRENTRKKCMTTGDIRSVLAAIETGDLDLGVSYDPTDAAGAGELESVFNSGEECVLAIELSDTAGVHGTTFTWSKAVVTSFSITPDDGGEVSVKFTVAPGAAPTVLAAA